MLGKVMKYDIKYFNRLILPYYLILFGLGAIVRILGLIGKHNTVVKITSTLVNGIFYTAIALVLVYTLVIILKRFYDNTYKDEGYLTHTLPVKRGSILDSKAIVSVIYVFLGMVAMVGSWMLGKYSPEGIEFIRNILDGMERTMGYKGHMVILYIVVLMIVSFYSYLFMIMAGMSIGQTFQDKRVLWSVVFSVVLYYVSQIISTVVLVVFSFGFLDMKTLINSNSAPTEFLNYSMGFGLGLSVIFTIGYYVIARWNLKRKLNLM